MQNVKATLGSSRSSSNSVMSLCSYTRSVCSRPADSQTETQQMLSSCPSSSLRDDRVTESNRAAFCLRPDTGLVAGPRSVHKAVLAGSIEHEKRSLAGWQRESLRTRREALPQRLTYIAGRTGRGAAGPDLAIKTN
jgi:hypothetical protein